MPTKKKATPKKSAKKTTPSKVKKAAKAVPTKSVKTKAKTPRKSNVAFMAPLTPDAALAAIVGASPLPRTEVTKRLWDYIKKNNLQDAKNRRQINADEKLRVVFGRPSVSMFEMNRLIQVHLRKA